jgi:hypothetical protein
MIRQTARHRGAREFQALGEELLIDCSHGYFGGGMIDEGLTEKSKNSSIMLCN